MNRRGFLAMFGVPLVGMTNNKTFNSGKTVTFNGNVYNFFLNDINLSAVIRNFEAGVVIDEIFVDPILYKAMPLLNAKPHKYLKFDILTSQTPDFLIETGKICVNADIRYITTNGIQRNFHIAFQGLLVNFHPGEYYTTITLQETPIA